MLFEATTFGAQGREDHTVSARTYLAAAQKAQAIAEADANFGLRGVVLSHNTASGRYVLAYTVNAAGVLFTNSRPSKSNQTKATKYRHGTEHVLRLEHNGMVGQLYKMTSHVTKYRRKEKLEGYTLFFVAGEHTTHDCSSFSIGSGRDTLLNPVALFGAETDIVIGQGDLERFTGETFEHTVRLSERMMEIYFGDEILPFISSTLHKKWSVFVERIMGGDSIYYFRFESLSDATMFKMEFSKWTC